MRVSSAAISGTAAQDLERPQRDVAEVADRRRDDVQRAAATPAVGSPRLAHPRAEPGRRRG